MIMGKHLSDESEHNNTCFSVTVNVMNVNRVQSLARQAQIIYSEPAF